MSEPEKIYVLVDSCDSVKAVGIAPWEADPNEGERCLTYHLAQPQQVAGELEHLRKCRIYQLEDRFSFLTNEEVAELLRLQEAQRAALGGDDG